MIDVEQMEKWPLWTAGPLAADNDNCQGSRWMHLDRVQGPARIVLRVPADCNEHFPLEPGAA